MNGPLPQDEPNHSRQPDISKAQSLLGWKPATIAYFEGLLREPDTMDVINNGVGRGAGSRVCAFVS